MGIPLSKPISKDTDRGREGGIFIPDGEYFVRVNSMELTEKKDESGSYIAAEYEIIDAKDEEGAQAIGLRIFDIFSLTETAEWKIAQFLDASYAPDKFEGTEIPDDIEGKELTVKTKNEKYQGRENVRVKAFGNRFDWAGQSLKTNDAGEHIVEGGGNAKAGADSKQVSV